MKLLQSAANPGTSSEVRCSAPAMVPVSCFIISKNEVERIGRCIRSVIGWVDEVVVVDCGSDDGTVELARSLGARVIHNDWPGFGQQKRFAECQCRNFWLLNLDADEEAPPELETEVRAFFKEGEPSLAAYAAHIHVIYPGQDHPRPFAKDHTCVRLYDTRRVRFRDSKLHDSVETKGHQVGQLKAIVRHHTFISFDNLIEKCDERASYSAHNAKPRNLLKLLARAAVEWPWIFTKYYILRRHCTAGWDGAKYAAIMADYRTRRLTRMIARTKKGGSLDHPQSTPSNISWAWLRRRHNKNLF
jgi:glycosyltransferase involved in cell wall biosynthesis